MMKREKEKFENLKSDIGPEEGEIAGNGENYVTKA
jgi:hypothetical protein